MTAPHPRLVIDGAEGPQGRALMLISALHLAAEKFKGIDLVLLGPDLVVAAAAEALHWDTGLSVEHEIMPAVALRQATLFAAVTFTDTTHLPVMELARGSIPSLVAIQFPDPARHKPATLALQRAAHDTRVLAEVLAAQFERP